LRGRASWIAKRSGGCPLTEPTIEKEISRRWLAPTWMSARAVGPPRRASASPAEPHPELLDGGGLSGELGVDLAAQLVADDQVADHRGDQDGDRDRGRCDQRESSAQRHRGA
jgi:hypothetical protein